MQQLPGGVELACAELSFEQLCLQRGLVGARWRRVHGVRRRQVQERQGLNRLQRVQRRDILSGSRGVCMPGVYGRLGLACGKQHIGCLQLQSRLLGARWWHLHSVRGRKVQGVDRISYVHGLRGRDLFYSSRSLSKLDVQRLSVKLQLACGERSFDRSESTRLNSSHVPYQE